MAGGKETPRQKMVGLMYLVLLALLALQVGAEIMVKFQQINDSMQLLVTESQTKSGAILSNIGSKVSESGNKKKDVAVLTIAQELHKRSSDLILKIEGYKEDLIIATGGYMVSDDGKDTLGYKGMKDPDNTSALLVGQGDGHSLAKEVNELKQTRTTIDGKGYAWSLQTELNDFVVELNTFNVRADSVINGDKFIKEKTYNRERYNPLALDGKDDPIFVDQKTNKEKIEGAKRKTFAVLNFDHTPMIAALAFLTEKQAKIAQYEGEVLAKLKNAVGASDFKFDKLDVMANADASTIAAGTKYKAKIFLTAFSDKIQPVISARGRKLKVTGGIGEIEFTAGIPKGAKADKNGLYPASYTAKIEVPDPVTGDLKPYTKKVQYWVSKPVIQVKAGDINALYKDCGNPLNIQVPALGALYAPSFVVSGGSYKKGGAKGAIIVVPTKATVAITVKSGGNVIGTEKFKVRLVPKPTIMATTRGKQINPKGVLAPGPRKIVMKAIAEPGFKSALPKDAKYRITKWTATLVRGKRPVVSPKTFKKPEGNLNAFAAKANNGDRIMIEVKKVYRRTSTGKNVEVRIPTTIINIPLTD
jgi:gliding motility-associated protein GldM